MKKQRVVPPREQDLILKDCNEMIEDMEANIDRLHSSFQSMHNRLDWLLDWFSPIESPPASMDADPINSESVSDHEKGELL